MYVSTLLCALALVHASYAGKYVKEEFAWKLVGFEWPSDTFKDNALKTNAYIPENNLPLGIANWKDKLFVTIPRWKAGVASSLNYVKIGSNSSANLIPYPSMEDNYIEASQGSTPAPATTGGRDHAPKAKGAGTELKSNSSIVSVFRLWVDKCDRLWVMDTGLADILGSANQIAKPSLVIFDLNTDKLIRRYFFQASDVKQNSFLANVVVDVEPETCEDAFAYVPDLGGYGLVVYSFKQDKSWRVNHHYFHFDPLAGEYRVGGISFQWTDGVFGVALSNKLHDGSRNVIFHAFSSTKEFQVSNSILQNETLATSPESFHLFKLLGERGPNTQASANYFDDKTGVLFYTQVNRDGVACWSSKKPLTPENTALFVSDPETMEFPNDLKIDNDGLIWILSDRLPKFMYKSLDSNEINFRISTIYVQDAIKDTVCS